MIRLLPISLYTSTLIHFCIAYHTQLCRSRRDLEIRSTYAYVSDWAKPAQSSASGAFFRPFPQTSPISIASSPLPSSLVNIMTDQLRRCTLCGLIHRFVQLVKFDARCRTSDSTLSSLILIYGNQHPQGFDLPLAAVPQASPSYSLQETFLHNG
ncbi:hypothetical protein IQ06DRAFT_30339 [Phaeosphaeriaceae sp. SRC1lsM3a]|nr:hypothetical protein IQ06DRAFT_30339 [Stagonospora sp. SRC1lsM3a]